MMLPTIIQTILCIIIKFLSIAILVARKLSSSILGKIFQLIPKLKFPKLEFIENLWLLPLKYIKKYLKEHTVQCKSNKWNSENFLFLLNPKHSNLRKKVKHQIPICTDSIAYYFHTANTPESSDSEESEETVEKQTEKSEEACKQKETIEMEVTETSTNSSEGATALRNMEQGENQPEVKMDETVKALKRKANESTVSLTKRKKSPGTSQPGFPTSQLDSKNIDKDAEIVGNKSSKTENLSLMDVEGAAESNLNNSKIDESVPHTSRMIKYTDNLHSGIQGNQSSIASFEDPNAGIGSKDMETGEHSTSETFPTEQSGSSGAESDTSDIQILKVVIKAKPKEPLRSNYSEEDSSDDSAQSDFDYLKAELKKKKNIPEKAETSAAENSEADDHPVELLNKRKPLAYYQCDLSAFIKKIEQNVEAIKSIDVTDFLKNKTAESWREKLAPGSCDTTESTDKKDSRHVCDDNRATSHENRNITAVSPIKAGDKVYRPFPGMAPDPKKVKKDAKYQKKFYRQQKENIILKKGESTEDRSQSSQIASESPSDKSSSKSAPCGFKHPSGMVPDPENVKKDAKYQKKFYRQQKESTILKKEDTDDQSQSSQIASESPSDKGSSKSAESVFKHPSGVAPDPKNVKKDAKYQKKFYKQQKERAILKKENSDYQSRSSQIATESPSGEDSSRPAPSGIGSQNVGNENEPIIHKKLGSVIDLCVENLMGYKRPSSETDIDLFSDRYRTRCLPPTEFNLSKLVLEGASFRESDIPETSTSSLSESRSCPPPDASLLPSTGLQTSDSAETTGSDPLRNSDKNKQTTSRTPLVTHSLDPVEPIYDPFPDVELKEHSIPLVPILGNQSPEIGEQKEITVEDLSSLRKKDGSNSPNLSDNAINKITKPIRCDPEPDFDLELVGDSPQPSSHEHTRQTMAMSSVLTEQETSTSKVESNVAQIALDKTSDSRIPLSTPSVTQAPVESKSGSLSQEKESFETSIRKIISPTSENKAEELPEHDKAKALQAEREKFKPKRTHSDAASSEEISQSGIKMGEETAANASLVEEQQRRSTEETPDLDEKINKSEFISIDESNNSQGEQPSICHKKGASEQPFEAEEISKMSLSSEKKITKEPLISTQDHGDRTKSEMESEESPKIECEAAKSPEIECEESPKMECEAAKSPEIECEDSHKMECEESPKIECEAAKSPEIECELPQDGM